MGKKRLATFAVGGVVVFGGLLQFVPANRTNPAVTREVRWDSQTTRDMAQRVCYDCHSNQTEWPWYS